MDLLSKDEMRGLQSRLEHYPSLDIQYIMYPLPIIRDATGDRSSGGEHEYPGRSWCWQDQPDQSNMSWRKRKVQAIAKQLVDSIQRPRQLFTDFHSMGRSSTVQGSAALASGVSKQMDCATISESLSITSPIVGLATVSTYPSHAVQFVQRSITNRFIRRVISRI